MTTFTLPYWEWLNQGRNCAVCTNDLIGESDLEGAIGVIDLSSAFSQWITACKAPEEKSVCRYCNFSVEGKPLVRFMKPMGKLPDTEQYEFTFNFTHYDEYPYNKYSLGGFRTALEGFLNKKGFGATMHNEVNLHIFPKNGVKIRNIRQILESVIITQCWLFFPPLPPSTPKIFLSNLFPKHFFFSMSPYIFTMLPYCRLTPIYFAVYSKTFWRPPKFVTP